MKTYQESPDEFMQDPEFRAKREVLEPEFEAARAIIEGKPLIGFPLVLIAKTAGVSLEEARVMQKGKQARVTRTGKRARAAVH